MENLWKKNEHVVRETSKFADLSYKLEIVKLLVVHICARGVVSCAYLESTVFFSNLKYTTTSMHTLLDKHIRWNLMIWFHSIILCYDLLSNNLYLESLSSSRTENRFVSMALVRESLYPQPKRNKKKSKKWLFCIRSSTTLGAVYSEFLWTSCTSFFSSVNSESSPRTSCFEQWFPLRLFFAELWCLLSQFLEEEYQRIFGFELPTYSGPIRSTHSSCVSTC